MSGYVQSNQIVLLPYTNLTLTAADSGKVLITPQTAGATAVVYTLPAVADARGVHYRFINGAPAALSGSVQITAPAGTLYGGAITGTTGASASLAIAGAATIGFATAASIRGDHIDLYCDGSIYYVSALSTAAAGILVA